MIQVINRAIDILEYVANDIETPKLMGHIAKDLKLNTATCANIIKTLTNRGLLSKVKREKGYVLGDKVLEIAQGTLGFQAIIEKAKPEMENAVNMLTENNLIAILNKNQRVVLHKQISAQLIQASTPDEKDAYDSSTGRLLIAMLPDKEIQLYLKRYGLPSKSVWADAASEINFLKQVGTIRKQGYALIEDSVQIIGIATPIYKNDKVIASFSIYVPSFRFNDEVRKKMIATAITVAERISKAIV